MHRHVRASSRPTDTHRPAWLRFVITFAASVGLILGSVALAPSAAAATQAAVRPEATRLASFDAQMVSYINAARAANGRPALKEAGGLTTLSVWWSQQMSNGATGGKLQHNPNAFQQVTRYGAANRTAWGENVAKFTASATAKQVFDAYMNSPGHRANILSSKYRYIGMGTVSDGTVAFNTMEFTDLIQGAAPAKPAAKADAKPAAKPAPKPAAKPAPKPAAKPAPRPTAKPTVRKTIAAPQAIRPVEKPAVVPAAPQLAHGTIAASFGALAASGMTVEIRDSQCESMIASAVTTIEGRFPVSLMPGNYCATLISGPGDVARPAPVTFTVASGSDFTVAFADLTRDTASRSVVGNRFVMQPR